MTKNIKFTFVTYCDLPNLDADDRLVFVELKKRGYECAIADWRDKSVSWANAGICLLRSMWNYHLHYSEFLDWLAEISKQTTVWNNANLVQWNSDKRYLLQLCEAGLPIVPTVLFEQGKPDHDVQLTLDNHGWQQAILKPCVGLSTHGVIKIKSGDQTNQEHLNNILQDCGALLQPYIETVHDRGERALVFLGGEYSHTIRKSAFQPLAQAGEADEKLVEVDEKELELAHRVVAQIDSKTAFARVDLIRDTDGNDLLMELELVEPSLYLGMFAPAAMKFADVLCQLTTGTDEIRQRALPINNKRH